MEFIKAEEFLGQPVGVQKVFVEWWQPSIGDLYSESTKYGYELKMIEYSLVLAMKNSADRSELFKIMAIPNLVEGQLREFIEDKTGCKVLEFKDTSHGQIVKIIKIGENKYIQGQSSIANLMITSNLLKCRFTKIESKEYTFLEAWKAQEKGIEVVSSKDYHYKNNKRLNKATENWVDNLDLTDYELKGKWQILK